MSRPRSKSLPTYSDSDFEGIAKAIGDDFVVSRLIVHRNTFEAAARWYEYDTASPRRAAPYKVRNKLKRTAAAARKLLYWLDIGDPADAPDGPGDVSILDALASVEHQTEDTVTHATARVGRLAEILEAIEATKKLGDLAEEAAQDVTHLGELTIAREHQGDAAVNNWIASMMEIYEQIMGKAPGTSTVAPARKKKMGTAQGPVIRFLEAAGHPLGISYSPSSWRSRVRAIKKSKPQKK